MKKRILFAIILTAIFAAIILSIFYQAPLSSSLQTKTETTKGENGTVTMTTYVNQSGAPIVASDKGYATVRTMKDEDGKKVLEEYLDATGTPIALSAGYASISYTYTDGLATTITYLDEEKNPVVISLGYDSIHRTYNDRRIADTDTYFAAGQPVMRTQGYAAYSRIYNDKKQAIMLEYRGLDGELININSGYARRIRSFNEQNKISEERYYNPDGSPAVLSLGQSGYTRRYDDQGRTIETTYIGSNGAPINTTRGYATLRTTYTDSGTKTQYYDKDGKPVTGGNSNYGVLNTGEQKIYLNEDGDVMHRLDNVLMTHPALVLILGTLLTILSLFLRGKARWVFLILYFFFVLYMTMYYREAQGSRNRLELFYSYRRMLSNDSLRQQVVNNILLFIPLGTILSNLLMDRMGKWKVVLFSVLICMVTSIGIEAVQWKFGIGLAEVDDVISNTLGGTIGAAIDLLARPAPPLSSKQHDYSGL